MSRPATVKRRNEALLQRLGVAVNPALPEIEDLAELSPRSPQDVAQRALVLSHLTCTGFGWPPKEVLSTIEERGLAFCLTPNEGAHLRKATYTLSEKGWAKWLVEAVQSCAWCLAMVPSIAPLERPSDKLFALFVQSSDPAALVDAATLRPIDEIYEQADLYYRFHWAARDARLSGKEFPQPESSAHMRRWALDWIVGLPHEWDDMPLDT